MATKITGFTKSDVRWIGQRIANLINSDPELQLAGVTGEYCGGSFEQLEATVKVRVVIQGSGGESPSAARYKQQAAIYGLDPAWLGQKFTTPQGAYELVGLANRRSRNIVEAKRLSDSRIFLFKPDAIKFYVGDAAMRARVTA